MIVYGHHAFRLNIPDFLLDFVTRVDRLPRWPSRDALVDLLVDFGEAYAATADRLQPVRDDASDALRPWSAAMQRIADAFCAEHHGERHRLSAALDRLRLALTDVLATPTTVRDVSASTAEGFAYYCLYPETLLAAAEHVVRDRSSTALACIGLRGIGAPLAHVVAAAAARLGVVCHVFTVRPRGHPFDRRLEITERLGAQMREASVDCAAIVDEGPGLSGSSFAAATEALEALGVDARRIVLLPSWRANPAALGSPRGRAAFTHHACFVVDFEDVWPRGDRIDISAGRWRADVFGDDPRRWPAVHPQHERRKYLSADRTRCTRFVGLGRYGRAAYGRAQKLAGAGFTPEPLDLAGGFLTERWVPGRRLQSDGETSAASLAWIARYAAFLAKTYATGRRSCTDDLLEMMKVNIGEALGPGAAAGMLAHFAADAGGFDSPTIALDGHMLPQEWVRVRRGLVKTDALDHHADDFFPGSRDIAWDLAGAAVELALSAAATSVLIEQYRRRTRDATIGRRLPFYRAAYLAYRLGYATLAAQSLGDTADGARFRRLAARYRRSLAAPVRSRP